MNTTTKSGSEPDFRYLRSRYGNRAPTPILSRIIDMSWRITVVAIIALAIALPDAGWAHGRGGARSGGKMGSGHRHAHYHHSFSSAFVLWSPWWYRGGYAYAPIAPYPEPPVYVERFSG